MQRRDILRLFAGACLLPRFALAQARPDDFFIVIHAAGGWDVTLWADPRNEKRGLVVPASTGNTETTGLAHWKTAAGGSFEVVTSSDSALRVGPAIGGLWGLRDRITIINGIATNTVSHRDGSTYAVTGRHLNGTSAVEPSVDVVLSSERGVAQLMPNVSIGFPSAFVGTRLDRRAIPFRVGSVAAITSSLDRSSEYLDHPERDAIGAVLVEEANELAAGSIEPIVYERLASQHLAMPKLLDGTLVDALSPKRLKENYPRFAYRGRFHGERAVVAAFAIEAMRRNLVRCVSFSLGGLDTHFSNYRQHANTLQELFDLVATLVRELDTLPHPTIATKRLSEATHILVVSEFCRTPQLNPSGGRDHYPNNSALVISPRFRGGRVFGATDPEQLLPREAPGFRQQRAITPPDVLATFLSAFDIDPRRYMRDGEVLEAMLA